MRRTALVAAAIALAVAACGYRTAVRPPEATAPVIPGAVTLERKEGEAVVHWKRAERSADGVRLDDLVAFAVERRRAGDEAWQRIAKIDVVDQEKIRRRKDFSYRDREAGDPVPAYRVIAICADGQEGPPADAVAKVEAAAPTEPAASPAQP